MSVNECNCSFSVSTTRTDILPLKRGKGLIANSDSWLAGERERTGERGRPARPTVTGVRARGRSRLSPLLERKGESLQFLLTSRKTFPPPSATASVGARLEGSSPGTQHILAMGRKGDEIVGVEAKGKRGIATRGPLWRVKMGDASLRNMGKVCLDTVMEGTDLLVEERRQNSHRR